MGNSYGVQVFCEGTQGTFEEQGTVEGQVCEKCGGRLARGYYKSDPESWANLAGRAGFMTLCADCGHVKDFQCTIMN